MGQSKYSHQSGFTVIELIAVASFLILAGFLVFFQMRDFESTKNDHQRKTAINAMYYALEEVYYKQKGAYPAKLQKSTLPSVDPNLFVDPDGFTLGEDVLTEDELEKILSEDSSSKDAEKRLASLFEGKSPNYYYEPTNCDNKGNCKSYTLRANMTKEAQYVKKSRNN